MAYYDEVIADTPRAYWRLGEASGTVANDATANNFDGTYEDYGGHGAASLLADGSTDTAGNFTGTGDATTNVSGVLLAGGSTILTGSVATLELLFNADSVALANQCLFELGGTTNGIGLWLSGSTLYGVKVASSTVYSVSHAGIEAGKTYHVAFVYESATRLALYVDGVLVAETTSGVPTETATGGDESGIGAVVDDARLPDGTAASGGTASTTHYGFDGRLDEVACYDAALTATRIEAHYDATGLGSDTGADEYYAALLAHLSAQ